MCCQPIFWCRYCQCLHCCHSWRWCRFYEKEFQRFIITRDLNFNTGMACLARPVTCEHDSHIDERLLDMFGRPEESVGGYPLLVCGCELVELPVDRVYRPMVLSLFCDDETVLLSPTVVWTIDDILADYDLEVPLPSPTFMEDRMEISRLLANPVVLQLTTRVPDFNLSEWVDAHDTVTVVVDWVLIVRVDVAIGNPVFVGHVGPTPFWPLHSVVCRHCAGMVCDRASGPRFHRVFDSPVQAMELEVDSHGQVIIDCEHTPKAYLARRHGRLIAAKFALKEGGMHSMYCARCEERTFKVYPPTNDVRFRYDESSFFSPTTPQQLRISNFPESVNHLYY